MPLETVRVITISRQLGSGGTYLGQRIARRLGYSYLDRQILKLAADKLKVDVEDLAYQDERVQTFWDRLFHGFSFGAPEGPYTPPPLSVVSDAQLFEVQQEIIKEVAARGSCVIVGHGASHLLRHRTDVLSVFVHAVIDFRINRVMRLYRISSRKEARRLIEHADYERANYVRTISGGQWSDACNFHLSLDSGRLGLPAAERVILSLAAPGTAVVSETVAPDSPSAIEDTVP